MWVKICANTSFEDAANAARLGADAVGFVFAPSKRKVSAEQVAEITPHLPAGIERVGVFTDASPEEIARIVGIAGLTTVQLHGTFDRGKIEQLIKLIPAASIIPVVHWDIADQGVHWKIEQELDRIVQFTQFRRILIDTKAGGASGGTGLSFDWHEAQPFFRRLSERGLQVILAGGLTVHNVEEAIRTASPWGVDVATGVEAAPGRKDPERLAEFIRLAQGI